MEKTRGVIGEIRLMRSWSDCAAKKRQAYLDATLKILTEERHRDRGRRFPLCRTFTSTSSARTYTGMSTLFLTGRWTKIFRITGS